MHDPNSSAAKSVLVHVMRIPRGKTNGLKMLYERCIEYKDVNLCPIAALSFYLLACFDRTQEGFFFDFLDNKQ